MGSARHRVQSGWLVSFASFVCFACAVAVAACGGKGVLGPAPGAAGSSGSGAAGSAGLADAGTAGSALAETHAENGVPLPSLDLSPESCGALGIETRPCSEDPCLAFSCACAPGLTFNESCQNRRCIEKLSCPAACASSDPVTAALECTRAGECRDASDCSGAAFCVRSPGRELGHCSSGDAGERCFQTADCQSGACVAGGYLTRTCSAGQLGDACNLDQQCAPPAHCLLQPQTFLGKCSDGSEGSPCATQSDCESPATCLAYRNGDQICSRGRLSSPCDDPAHCSSGFCAQGQCTDGEVGARCDGPESCKRPYCAGSFCTTGGNGAPCQYPADCANEHCVPRRDERSVCSDGSNGSACSNAPGSVCQIGLRCTDQPLGNGPVCLGPAPTGAPCGGGNDCESSLCASYKGGPDSVCTSGKLGEHCLPGQCVPGLFCASTGLNGICVSGAPGDPCTDDASCKSGTCRATVVLDDDAQLQCATATGTAPCGNGGACIFRTCHPRSCQ